MLFVFCVMKGNFLSNMNEKENTFRRLTEEPLLVTSFWCSFGWHKWTKYREPEKVKDSYAYILTIQSRRCGSCNLADRKVLSKD